MVLKRYSYNNTLKRQDWDWINSLLALKINILLDNLNNNAYI